MSSSITENARYKPLMIDALKGLPTISLSLAEPNRLNTEEEKLLSIEMIFADGKKDSKRTQELLTLEAISQTSQKNLSESTSEGNMEHPNLDTPSLMDSNTIPPPAQEFDSINLRLVHDMIDSAYSNQPLYRR